MSNLELSRAERLDQRVVALLPDLSRSFAAKLIEDGKVTVNGEIATKAGLKLREDDTVAVDYDTAELEQIPDIVLPVIYEDNDVVVINKPVGVLAHSKGAFNPEATVATWLRSRIKGMEGQRAGIVHRLDRATSGVMICAKNQGSLAWLQKQFSTRKVKKTYVAVVEGHFKEAEAVIDMPIERNPRRPQTFRVGSNGKVATTQYRVGATSEHYSEVELMPLTGRTHQLRVHLAELGHPIVGDELYGAHSAERMLLHAKELEITLPNRERKVFEAALPVEFKEFLQHDN